jgi:hypothetical protein
VKLIGAVKPRSPGRDDYYSRRLSRPSSSLAGSLNSPSLPSVHLSASTASIARSFSAGREVSGGGPSRTSSLGTSKRRDVAERESHVSDSVWVTINDKGQADM